jgi:hypothetical protein
MMSLIKKIKDELNKKRDCYGCGMQGGGEYYFSIDSNGKYSVNYYCGPCFLKGMKKVFLFSLIFLLIIAGGVILSHFSPRKPNPIQLTLNGTP